jgi:DNA-binding PadR family transcriptional regulator
LLVDTPLSAKAALLQALAVPGYGLDLLERVQRDSAGLIRLRPGSVYPALRAMEQEGLVSVRPAQAGGRRGRPRRYYELTLRGVQVAMAQRDALLDLLGGPGVIVAVKVGEMRRRLESCSSLSASVLELEGRVRSVTGSRR